MAGLDISEKMVQAARRAMDSQFPGQGVCIAGDVDALPFETGSFDCAVSVGVLSHQSDPRRAVAELSRVVDDDGFVVVTVVNLLKLQHLLDPFAWIALTSRLIGKMVPSSRGVKRGLRNDVRGGAILLRKYHLGELGAVLEDSGLAIRELLPCTFGPLSFWRKEVLPLAMSVRLSRALEMIAARRGFGFLRLFANSWVVCLDKSGSPRKRRVSPT